MKRRLLATCLLAAAIVGVASVAGAEEGTAPSGPEACVADRINERRQAPRLEWTGAILEELRLHASHMASDGDLSHAGMNARVAALPAGWSGYGEAAHLAELHATDEAAVADWCRRVVEELWASAPHRDVLSRPAYGYVSVGTHWDGRRIWVTVGVFSHPDYQPQPVAWPDRYNSGLSGSWKGRFLDDDTSVFEHDIERLAAAGITLGCNPPLNSLFCPREAVSREQMAAFLVRALGLPRGGGRDFVDDDGSVFEGDIEALAASAITEGCNAAGDRFCPDRYITRAEMATFLGRALGLEPSSTPRFEDTASSVHAGYINALAEAGITVGCDSGGNRYCPDQPVTRAQMAAFLVRAGLAG